MKRRAFIVFGLINPHGVKAGTAHIDVAAIESYATASGVHGGTIVRTTSAGVFHVDMTPDEIADKLIEAWRVMAAHRLCAETPAAVVGDGYAQDQPERDEAPATTDAEQLCKCTHQRDEHGDGVVHTACCAGACDCTEFEAQS